MGKAPQESSGKLEILHEGRQFRGKIHGRKNSTPES